MKQQNLRTWCKTGNISDFQSGDSCSNQEVRIQLIKDNERFQMNQVIKNYHSYRQNPMYSGRQINWWIKYKGEIVGVIGIGSCVFICPIRDEFIGYRVKCINHLSKQEDKDYYKNVKIKSLNKIANNWRFTLMPNAPKNCASKVLSLLIKAAKKEWKKQYKDELVLLETFVEPPRTGILYKASGWELIGMTKGDSIRATIEQHGFSSGYNWDGGHHKTTKKYVFLKPLHRYWRRKLLK